MIGVVYPEESRSSPSSPIGLPSDTKIGSRERQFHMAQSSSAQAKGK